VNSNFTRNLYAFGVFPKADISCAFKRIFLCVLFFRRIGEVGTSLEYDVTRLVSSKFLRKSALREREMVHVSLETLASVSILLLGYGLDD